jgi:ElaB/YqjD/DUF883 family membrane-anchored ribosome-binding protein
MRAATDLIFRVTVPARQASQRVLGAARQRCLQAVHCARYYVERNPVRTTSYSSVAALGMGVLIGRLLAPHPFDAASAAAFARGRRRAPRDAAKETSEELRVAAQDTAQRAGAVRVPERVEATREYGSENPWRTASCATGMLLGAAAILGAVSMLRARRRA